MAHPADPPQNVSLLRDPASSWGAELVAAILVWGGVGWALDTYVLRTAPWLMVSGFVLGFVLGMYLMYVRSEHSWREEQAARSR